MALRRIFPTPKNWQTTQCPTVMGQRSDDEFESADSGKHSEFQLLQSVSVQTENVPRSRRRDLLSSETFGALGTGIEKNGRSNWDVWRGR